MEWNSYLYETIKKRILKYPNKPIFRISDSKGNMASLSNSIIMENIKLYSGILEKYTGKICAIYHEFDEGFVGFVIAAFRCNVKLLIRRTTIDAGDEVQEDLCFLQKVLPVQLIFSKNGVCQIDTMLIAEDEPSKECDFVQLSSGTTDSSKAFCLSVEGLIKSAKHIENVQHVDCQSIFLSYLTLSHIYGFVSGFMLPIISGAVGLFCKTNYIKNDSTLLLRILSKEKVTHTSIIMNTLLLGLKEKDYDWDLSSLVCASLGGEKVDIATYEILLREMMNLGMSKTALVNSYGMSEKGSISMGDPYVGNYLYEKEEKVYVSVGSAIYDDTEIIVFDENYDKVDEDVEGMIGVCSPYISRCYYQQNMLHNLNLITIDNKEWYHNGDCGFLHDGKVFVTGRKINTITYNGLKILADILNESIIKTVNAYSLNAKRCFCFNYPGQINYVVCFIDYSGSIDNTIIDAVREYILDEYHIKISDFWNESYVGHGLKKISLPDIISKYTVYLDKRNKTQKEEE